MVKVKYESTGTIITESVLEAEYNNDISGYLPISTSNNYTTSDNYMMKMQVSAQIQHQDLK